MYMATTTLKTQAHLLEIIHDMIVESYKSLDNNYIR
jgi:hypothetical protein